MSFGERFLVNPDLFPARPSGEPWGEREVVLDLPGGPYRFAGLSESQEVAVRRRFGGFCRPGGASLAGLPAGTVESRVFRASRDDFREIDVRGWEYGVDLGFAPDSVRLAGLRFLGRLDWRPGLAGALWTCETGGDELSGVFENFFRALASYRILEQGGVILHSAGLVQGGDPGDAFLFLGRSGAGKSTVSRLGLENGATVLSDDLNAVCCRDGSEIRVERLPFTGDFGDAASGTGFAGGAQSYPLRALFRLVQSPVDGLRPLSRAEALACLLACCPFVNTDPYRAERLESVLLSLAAAFPSFELRFTLAGSFWHILDRAWPTSTSISTAS